MTRFKRSKDLASECFARSSDGMLVKSELVEDGVEVFWQVRTRVIGEKVVVYDGNGNVIREMDRARAIYPPSMMSAGVIPIGDDFVSFCGEDRYEDTVWAVMRHAAHMVAAGYGESPEHVVELLSDLRGANFINGVSYRLENCVDQLAGCDGLPVFAYINEEDKCRMIMSVSGEEYEEDIPDLVAFLISSTPMSV